MLTAISSSTKPSGNTVAFWMQTREDSSERLHFFHALAYLGPSRHLLQKQYIGQQYPEHSAIKMLPLK